MRSTIARRRTAIVLYHDPEPASFAAQLEYLTRRYAVIPIGRLAEALRSGDWSGMPRRSVVITLDDGRAGNHRLAESLRDHGVTPTVYLCTAAVETDGFLARDEIATLSEACEFGSHTQSHPVLPACPAEQAEREISDSKADVEVLTGKPCRHFAYPAGAYSPAIVDLVRRVGYASAHTVDIGWNGPRSDAHRLKVLSIDPQTPTRLAADLAGMSWLTRLLEGKSDLRGRRRPADPPGVPRRGP